MPDGIRINNNTPDCSQKDSSQKHKHTHTAQKGLEQSCESVCVCMCVLQWFWLWHWFQFNTISTQDVERRILAALFVLRFIIYFYFDYILALSTVRSSHFIGPKGSSPQFPTYLIYCCLTFVSLFCLTKSSSNLPKACENNTQACFSPLLLFPTLPHPPLLQISRLINRCSTEPARQRAAVAASQPLSIFLVPGKTNKTHIKFRFLVFRCYYFTFTLYGADVYHSFSTPFSMRHFI